MSDNTHFGLLLGFDTDEPQFARGFEMGRIWEMLRDELDEPLVETVHASNAEMVLRIAEARDFTVTSVDLDDEWIEVTFS